MTKYLRYIFTLPVVFIFFGIFTNHVLAIKEVGFQVTDTQPFSVVGRNQTYDYSPSVLREDNGETKVYVCGGAPPGDPYAAHDAIYLTIFNSSGVKTLDSKRVLSPLISNPLSDDAVHACAPSVIKHSLAQIEGGVEKYLMYYECAPKVYRKSDGAAVNIFTQTCVAFSNDGINWKKYNEDIWASQFRFANENEPPTAVVPVNPAMATKFGIEKIGGKYWTSLDAFDINAYGTGHPSALVQNGQIWLYYFDSVGDWNERGPFLAKSNDGFHFYPSTKISDIKSPPTIEYIAIPANGYPGFFLYLGNAYVNHYNYSWDGIHWAWAEQNSKSFYTDFLANNYSIGLTQSSRCSAPGGNAIAADKNGTVNSSNIDIYSNEGSLGISDSCTATNGCTCYSPLEDTSRGSTWQTYAYHSKAFAIPTPTPTPTLKIGDINNDLSIDILDIGIILDNYGKTSSFYAGSDLNSDSSVDILDLGIVLDHYGK